MRWQCRRLSVAGPMGPQVHSPCHFPPCTLRTQAWGWPPALPSTLPGPGLSFPPQPRRRPAAEAPEAVAVPRVPWSPGTRVAPLRDSSILSKLSNNFPARSLQESWPPRCPVPNTLLRQYLHGLWAGQAPAACPRPYIGKSQGAPLHAGMAFA
jgi:hypothetical protein